MHKTSFFFFSVLCTTVPLKKLHSFSSRVHPHLYIYSMTALFSGRMTGGKWHVVIWHESNGFEACLEDMTKDLAPSAGSQLIACMTKSDLICRSVWHFKTQKVKVFNTEREREREAIQQNKVRNVSKAEHELHLPWLSLLWHWSPLGSFRRIVV